MELIQVPKQSVHIPGNGRHALQEFAITHRPVSAADFALFAKRTGYLTAAERERQEFTVYDNPSVNGTPFADWSSVSALFVGRHDVVAFCDYHGVSLPSPSQWVAFVRHVTTKRLFALPLQTKACVPQL